MFHAAALKKLEYYEGVLFVEKIGETCEKLIKEEKKLVDNRNIKIIGTIVC